MADYPPESERAEESRIYAAYARRNTDALYSWFETGHLFFIQERERQVLEVLKNNGFSSLETKQILEIGCGTGYWLREFIKWGAQPQHITGVDLLPDRVEQAKLLCPADLRIECTNATKLRFDDATFDLVLQSTVFTSVLDDGMKRQMAREMIRVVNREGLIIWYDYHVNNPWNADVRGVKKREISRLFPGCKIKLKRITLAPPLYRLFAPYSWLVCYMLERLKIANTHYLGVITRNE